MALSDFPLTQEIIDRFSPVIPSLRGAFAGEMAQAGNELRSIQAAQAALAANPNANVDEIQRAIALALQSPPPAAPASKPQTVDQITATANTALQDPTISTASRPVASQPQPQRGGGLLEMFGLQKMQPGAQGETGQKFYERDRFKDFSGTMANWLNSMTLNPDPNLAANMDAGKQRRTANKSRNRTVDYLRKTGMNDLADMMEAGQIDAQAVMSELLKKRLSATNGAYSKEQMGMLNTLRDDLRTDLGIFEQVRDGYQNIITFYENGNAVSDYALAVSFAKVLDPGSVAREGEVAAVQNAGAKFPALQQALINSITGTGSLTQAVRHQIAEATTNIYRNKAKSAQYTLGQYQKTAESAGLPADLLQMSALITEPVSLPSYNVPQSAIDAGITQEQWNTLSIQDKREFM